ncbi:MAG: outer membrane protein assembly factor BamE [Desulfobacterales bacterium]|nr:outer membrane protein assembly factor BamE [Desulfobacterales bacterium]
MPIILLNNKKSIFLKLIATIAFLLTIISITGCATVGHDFQSTQISDIKIGVSTQSDIRKIFGSPWRVGIEDGLLTWTYGLYRYKVFSESSSKDLVVRFDSKKIVSSYTYNTTDHHE